MLANINSNDREDEENTETNNFLYKFRKPIDIKDFGGVIIQQMIIANTFYSVRANFNITLRVKTPTEEITVSWINGTYTSTALASMIATELNNAFTSTTFTVTFDEIEDVLEFSGSTTFQFLFEHAETDDFMFRLLGFKKNSTTVLVSALSSTFSPRLRDQFLYINVTFQIGERLHVDTKTKLLTTQVPIIGEYRNNIVFFNSLTGLPVYAFDDSIGSVEDVNIEIFGEGGTELDLRNGQVSFVLKFI